MPAEWPLVENDAPVRLEVDDGVTTLRASSDPRWSHLVADSRSALFVDPRWYRVLEQTYGLEINARTCHNNTLAYSDIDDPRGRRIVSLPFCDFVDTSIAPDAWPTLVEPLVATGACVILETGPDHPAENDPRFTSVVDGVSMTVALDAPLEKLFEGFATLTRRQIRKSNKRGIEFVATQDPTALRRFHELHVGVRKYRHGLLAQPFEMFESIANNFGNDWTLIAGFVDGEMIGGCLLIRTDSTWHYKFSVSHPDFRSFGVSHGAVYGALAHCVDTNATTFDFGRSDLAHGGLVDFKRRFGAAMLPLTRHVTSPLAPNTFSDELQQLTKIMTDPNVPDSLSAQAGSVLYRYFA